MGSEQNCFPYGKRRVYLDQKKTGIKIAVSGKGGVGKTTVSAILAELLAKDGLDVLAIDADSDANLASALGVEAEKAPPPLIGMKELISRRTGSDPASVGQYFKLNPAVSDLPEKYWLKVGSIKLLVLGCIERAGGGCACPEGAFLKALLAHTLLQRQEAIIVDLAAGLEFMGRACVHGIDALIVVVEPGSRSIETAVGIANMAKTMAISTVAAFINKITDESQVQAIKSQLGNIPVLGSFGYEPSIQSSDLNRKPVITASADLVSELSEVKYKLMGLLGKK
jgi:CO dehydrogenase maturation factor